MPKFEPLKLENLKTYSLAERPSKVSLADCARRWQPGGSLASFLQNCLPSVLAAGELKTVIGAVADAHRRKLPVVLAMGAHVIKVGLNPVVIDLMEKGILTCLAMNGAGIIHDFELAYAGHTSEDVAVALEDGSFGMAAETCSYLGRAIQNAAASEQGLGQAVGETILAADLAYSGSSLLAAGARLGIPVTVHIALGTDIIHMHPEFDPAAAGAASHRDFRTLAAVLADLEGGVFLNVGSAVILPEVFLKALTLVRNMGHRVKRFTTVNMDFIRHYRPMTNVVQRPTAEGGHGYNLIGHHEIMLPLLAAGVIEAVASGG
jgi:hypothetical protein